MLEHGILRGIGEENGLARAPVLWVSPACVIVAAKDKRRRQLFSWLFIAQFQPEILQPICHLFFGILVCPFGQPQPNPFCVHDLRREMFASQEVPKLPKRRHDI